MIKAILLNTLGKCRGQSLGFVGDGFRAGILGPVMLYLRLKSHGAYPDYILKLPLQHQGLVTVVPKLGRWVNLLVC